MKHITKLLGIIFLLCLNVNLLVAQEEDLDVMVKAKMDSIFEHIDKSQFETGLLSDYGCLLIDPSIYDGTLNEMNYVAMPDWKFLYLGMYTARVNGNTVLKDPDQVFSGLDQKSPAILCLQYNRIDETALEDGRLIMKDEQLWETGRYGSPYIRKDLFAVGLPRTEYHREVSFTFSKDNYISNRKDMPTQLAVRFTCESGYRDIVWGQPVSYNFTSYGEKEISIRATYSDGTTLESHSRIRIVPVLPMRSAPKADVIIPIDPTSEHSGGQIQIKYAQFNKKGKLIKPLIIADESDISKIILEDKEIDLNYLFDNEMKDAMETINKLYDIVYIDNNDGFDDILRNAKLFEEAIQKINTLRDVVYDKSYVIGLGMGGLVARYALRDMENKGLEHNVQKYISINTPHKGANIPVGIQALLQYIQRRKAVRKALSDYMDDINKITSLFEKKAIKQMLVYTINRDYQYLHDHDEFMQKYEAIGMPQQCENIAISNSGLSGMLEKEGSPLFSWNDKFIGFKCKIYFLKQQQASLFFSAAIKMIWCKFKEEELKSTNTMLAVDGAQGSFIPINLLTSGMGDLIAGGLKLSRFCFVPTASALGFTNWHNRLLSGMTLDSESSNFDKIYATKGNYEYTQLTVCKDFLLQELAPQIGENNVTIFDNATFTLVNVPSIFKLLAASSLKVDWYLSNDNFKIVSSSKFEVVVAPVTFESSATLKAVLSIQGMDITFETFPVSLKSGRLELTGNKFISPIAERYSINKIPSGATLSWSYASNLKVIEKKDNYIIIKDISDKGISNPLWIQANLQFEGNIIHRKMDLKRMRIENIELECLQNKMVTINGERKRRFTFRINAFPNDISDENISYCWSASAFDTSKRGTIQGMVGVKLDIRTHEDACRHLPIEDSITFVTPPLSTFSLPDVSFIEPDEYDLEPPFPNYITIFVPMSQSGDSILGTVQAVVRDNYYNFKATQAPIWNYWVSTYRISPNPSNTILNLIQENPQARLLFNYKRSPEIITINLYNNFGLMRSVEADTSQTDIQMNVADLPNGTYYLNILKNGEVIDKQVVMIKH